MSGGKRGANEWQLEDLADFEALLSSESATRNAKRVYREEVKPHLPMELSEAERRRQGLLLWTRAKRESVTTAGQQLTRGLTLMRLIVSAAAFLFGIGIMRGLLLELPQELGRGFNLWLLLAVALGLQWLFLIAGGLGYLFFRGKKQGGLFREFLLWLGRKLSGSKTAELWGTLAKVQSTGYQSALGWRLARISQLGAVWMNFGLVVGLVGLLFIYSLQFYWESTLGSFSQQQLVGVSQFLSAPWFFMGELWRPGEWAVERTNLAALVVAGGEVDRSILNQTWLRFLVLALMVWGVLPRVVLSFIAARAEKKSLRALDFQESRHRQLWREMTHAEMAVVKTSQADGVVLLDAGGIGVDAADLRPFLLQQLRCNPTASYQLGALSSDKDAVLAAMAEAELGVVIVVEGWDLSKPAMTTLQQRLREKVGAEKRLVFLVIGTFSGGGPVEASEAEVAEWVKFVDSLRDPACEVAQWKAAA